MEREPVTSSNVESIGYDPATETLEVEFKNGGVYQYDDVPASVYQELMEAPSVGRFLGTEIKGQFRCERLE